MCDGSGDQATASGDSALPSYPVTQSVVDEAPRAAVPRLLSTASRLALLWFLLALAGCGRDGRPSVLLITVDTLRADRLGCYGYESAQTPNIDRLASEGVLFEQVGAQAPVTLPSHATILTGLTPATHGLHDNSTFSLSDTVTTVAEVFREAGYRTAAVIGAYVLARQFGLGQGFVAYEDSFPQPEEPRNTAHFVERPAGDVTDIALRWLGAHGDEAFFLWLHYFDPHFPYTPPAAFGERFAESPYDGEIAYVDHEVGRVLQYLGQLGMDGTPLILFTADHGEGLGEHGEETHSQFLYETTLRVPLIIRWTGRIASGVRVGGFVRTQDIVPTMLELVGLPAQSGVEGQSLVRVIRGAVPRDTLATGETLLPFYHFGLSPLVSVRTSTWKYVEAPEPELYNLVEDPGESQNVASTFPGIAAQLSDAARGYSGRVVGAGSGHRFVSEEQEQKLQALGYLTSQPRALPHVGEWRLLGDPKEYTEVISLTRRASILVGSGKPVDALPIIEEALRRSPSMQLLRRHQAAALLGAGRVEDAVTVIQQGMAQDSSYFDFPAMLGRAELARGRPAEALEAVDLALQLVPFSPSCLHLKGLALFALGRPQDAIEAYRSALHLQPSFWEARLALSETLLALRQPDAALAQAQAVLHRAPLVARVPLVIARCHEAMGRWAEAADAYAQALRADTTLAAAHWRMAWCYHQAGLEEKAAGALEDHVKRYGEHSQVLSLVGAERAARGDTAGAVAAWERAVELDSTTALAWAGLVTAAARHGAPAAQEVASRALSVCPEDTMLRGLVERLTGKGRRLR